MMNSQSFKKRKMLIAINLIALLFMIAFFEIFKDLLKSSERLPLLGGIMVVFLLIIVSTYYAGFYKTRLWQLIHISSSKLDEREIQVINTGLKYAYAIFIITTLVLIYGHTIIGIPMNAITAIALVYLAHIMPAAVIGWREKDISWGNVEHESSNKHVP